MASIIVTDGEQRAALAIVRSLGRAGHRCVVTSRTGRSLAGSSRHAERDVAVPDAAADPAAYVAAVEALARGAGTDLVIPVSEAALLALLAERERIPAPMPFPDLATFQAICDKARVLDAATSLGIRVPRQKEAACPEADVGDLRYPLVLKPRRSVATTASGRRVAAGVRWVHEPSELRSQLAAFSRDVYPILVQEAVVGPGIGVFVLVHEGRLVARFGHRRLREKPPSGGVSVLRQSEPIDDALLEHSLALLGAFGWSGVAMVEYKIDAATGEAALMEINGRFWGSLQLAIDAGVDFPGLLADLSLGRPVEPVEAYGFARSRWFWGDVDHVIARFRDPNVGVRDRVAAVVGWLKAFGRGYRSEVFRWDDPKPFLRETLHWFEELGHS